jgi:hypothetical protein
MVGDFQTGNLSVDLGTDAAAVTGRSSAAAGGVASTLRASRPPAAGRSDVPPPRRTPGCLYEMRGPMLI